MQIDVVIPVFPGFQLLDVAGPIAVFEAASHFATDGGYRTAVVSALGGTVPSSAGLALDSAPFDAVERVDTLLVPGGAGTRNPQPDPRLIDFLTEAAARGRRVTSVCTGAFLLARAGLLDGRRATTHWRHAHRLARRHPAVRVVPDRIWVNDGRVWTSAGVSAGIDLALALVADDFGREVARRAAREVVVAHQRPGGQSQFSEVAELCDPRGRFAPLLDWIRANLTRRLQVEDLAERMAMSPRNFSRRFRTEVGRTPAEAVAQIRLEAARLLVETTTRPIEQIARDTGFGDAERMRRTFVRVLGQSPRALRTASRAA
ncbi:MAG TPA: GlxA family transcriptional regulator [Pseudomonadales bacterium]